MAMDDNEISTNGYANFCMVWFDKKVKFNEIRTNQDGEFVFTEDYKQYLFEQMKKYE
jgi:hypothetical protein